MCYNIYSLFCTRQYLTKLKAQTKIIKYSICYSKNLYREQLEYTMIFIYSSSKVEQIFRCTLDMGHGLLFLYMILAFSLRIYFPIVRWDGIPWKRTHWKRLNMKLNRKPASYSTNFTRSLECYMDMIAGNLTFVGLPEVASN